MHFRNSNVKQNTYFPKPHQSAASERSCTDARRTFLGELKNSISISGEENFRILRGN